MTTVSHSVRIYYPARIKDRELFERSTSKHEPRIFEYPTPFSTMGEILDASKQLSCQVKEWSEEADAFLMRFVHSHDGTLTFTMDAISVVARAVEQLMQNVGGSWESSYVYIWQEDDPGLWMEEAAYIFVRPLSPETESAAIKWIKLKKQDALSCSA